MKSLPVAFAVMLAGCASSPQPGGETPQPAATEPAPHEAQAPAVESRKADLVGRWTPTLPPREAVAITIARSALADPPDRAAFEATNPTAEDARNFENLLRLRKEDPNSPLLADVREKLAAYDAMSIDFTPTTIEFRSPGKSESNRYHVVSERNGVIGIAVENDDDYQIVFVDRDHLEMRGRNGRTMSFTRIGAAASKRPPADAPVAARKDGAAAPAPTGSPADACDAYARCIEQMPRLKGDEAVMGGSANVIRSWEKTPDQLRQCASAHELARSTGLCR